MYKTARPMPGMVGSTTVVSRPLNTYMIWKKEFAVMNKDDKTYKQNMHMEEEFKEKDLLVIGAPRLMESKDLPTVFALFKKQQSKYDFQVKFSQDDLMHHLMNEGVVYTIVFEV
jgi:hypothetical protein|tara:strand:+ start:874 stop:1215 length:342 start_codon:yes stop_codon:yes gene_type:complete